MTAAPDPNDPLLEVLDVLEHLGLRHHLGGSYASSVHGLPRQTRDADLVVEFHEEAVPGFVKSLEDRFYLDEDRIRHAVRRRSSFNLIHLATGFKVDVFVKGTALFDESELKRSQVAELAEMGGRAVPVKSPEDTVLRKLLWFSEGGKTSERQWSDVLGVLKVQRQTLELEYLERWADVLGVRDLLTRALEEA